MKTRKEIAEALMSDLKAGTLKKVGIEEIIAAVRAEGVDPATHAGSILVDSVSRAVVELVG